MVPLNYNAIKICGNCLVFTERSDCTAYMEHFGGGRRADKRLLDPVK